MEQIILDEIEKLQTLRDSYDRHSQGHAICESQIYILRKVLQTDKRRNLIALLLKDNQDNYDMGLIIPAEYAKRISEINSI
jgi:hypothetical protein